MEEFILEGEPFKFSYEGVDYTCVVHYLGDFEGEYFFRIDVSQTKTIKIFRWNFEYQTDVYTFRGKEKGKHPFIWIKDKKYFGPDLVKETLLSKFEEEKQEEVERKALNERIKNIKIIKEL